MQRNEVLIVNFVLAFLHMLVASCMHTNTHAHTHIYVERDLWNFLIVIEADKPESIGWAGRISILQDSFSGKPQF